MELEGTILAGRDFEAVEGRVVVEDGRVAAVEEANVESDDVVLPAFVNAHTHIGDSIAKDAGRGLSLEELVAPPDGLKHRLLREADRAELVEGMRRSLSYMAESGTAATLEFREGGAAGVESLREASEGVGIDALAFGRDDPDVLDVSDGYGASGANDADFTVERGRARDAGKPFAIHAGEVDETDIHPALDLNPDLLVHMVHADDDHLARVEETDTPVAVCPRSNLVTDVGLPDVPELLAHTTVALGTDNVMLNSPSMFREMAYTAKRYDVTAVEVLRMATTAGAEIAGRNDGLIEAGRTANLLVLDGDSHNLAGYRDPVRAAVRRASASDVKRVLHA
ncbi:cytosine/adenosine deaminase-related metal-dependent hydrolase [Halarchaeum rubridurum]|uniref:Cytosine/adenosine deaminase-related metal-dependent hydrolase n=1 Tax=Halarchaeum rubridurum TaxID=489911 RepID=A0A830FXT2_9EURY|nr:amidohydrolase family protein [Halarchaeum rubridurum]MBP1953778.1 cytosine/adenosine deaminase-related metal-dependent hydrolase [Halarchaeum rubridurum]GGM54628.1 nucleoside deaminase [Halarchaeum rubridurum]